MTRLEPVHPGEILKHDFMEAFGMEAFGMEPFGMEPFGMEPFGLSATARAKALGVTPARIDEIVRGRRGITAATALRIARFFGSDAQSWMNLQDRYELSLPEEAAAGSLESIRPLEAA